MWLYVYVCCVCMYVVCVCMLCVYVCCVHVCVCRRTKRPKIVNKKLKELLGAHTHTTPFLSHTHTAEAKLQIMELYSKPIEIPKTAVEGEASMSTKVWEAFSDYNTFVKHWVSMERYLCVCISFSVCLYVCLCVRENIHTHTYRASRYLAFLKHIEGSVVHPEYTVLVRNGRTSCSHPAIQQTPRSLFLFFFFFSFSLTHIHIHIQRWRFS